MELGFIIDKVAELDWDEVDKSILDEVEADTYYCISRLLDGIQDHYTTDQPGIQRMVKKLEDLVRRIDLDCITTFNKRDSYSFSLHSVI